MTAHNVLGFSMAVSGEVGRETDRFNRVGKGIAQAGVRSGSRPSRWCGIAEVRFQVVAVPVREGQQDDGLGWFRFRRSASDRAAGVRHRCCLHGMESRARSVDASTRCDLSVGRSDSGRGEVSWSRILSGYAAMMSGKALTFRIVDQQKSARPLLRRWTGGFVLHPLEY